MEGEAEEDERERMLGAVGVLMQEVREKLDAEM